MKRKISELALVFVAFICVLSFFNSCEKPSDIGLETQPPDDKLNVIYCDTISLVTYSVLEDSIRTDETSYNLLGCYTDPIFGKHTTGFYSQVRLSSNAPTFGANPHIDSLVLAFRYRSYYGDTLAPQSVKVYQISEDIYKDSSYYSNRELNITGNLLGSKSFYPMPTDSIYVGDDTLAAQLRIRLDTNCALGTAILNLAGSSELSDNSKFLEYFKGIYVTATPVSGTGCIMSFDLLNSLSYVALHYHNDNNDSLTYYMVFNENCARFNHFNHSKYLYADPYLRSELYGDTTKGDSLLYLQGMAGLKIKIKYPYILDLVKNGKIAINKAELIIPVEENTITDNYPVPDKLMLIEEKDGSIRFLLDQYESATYYGGTFDKNENQYKFNIARHMQQVIDGIKENLGLSLVIYTTERPNKANRVVIKGPKRTENFRLLVTYTKLY